MNLRNQSKNASQFETNFSIAYRLIYPVQQQYLILLEVLP